MSNMLSNTIAVIVQWILNFPLLYAWYDNDHTVFNNLQWNYYPQLLNFLALI